MIVRFGTLTRRVLVVAVALAGTLALAACGSTSTPVQQTTAGPGNALTVTITDTAIEPASMSARMGPIQFTITNQGQKVHNLAVDDNGVHYQSPDIQPGQTIKWTVTINTPSPAWFYSSVDNDRADGLRANVNIATGE